MRQVSEVRSHDPPARRTTAFRSITMAIHEVRDGHHRSFDNGARETPFSIVYGVEALIPVEVEEPSARFWHTNEGSNNEAMATALELPNERREALLLRMAAQKQKIERYYNRRTNLQYFGIGDLILRKVTLNTRNPNEGKLGQNWEGSYLILGIVGKGSYKLSTMEGEQLLSNWNVSMLKRYYC
uniref:Uncharacterized protein LOC104210760 n=1 Tax=Nicotiana sylvestris TaxID=4096 RepID=A0A1U7V701_NICSY|nr:PREDICTED: uncharacterized protein LOC104210760 [Nicotiana sylvestris]